MGKKSKSKTEPWKKAQPYILSAANELQGTYDANKGNLASLSSNLNASIPEIAARALGNNAATGQAKSYVSDVLGGKYLSGNPYLQGIVDTTNNSIQDRINSVFSAAGRTGGSGHGAEIAKQVAAAENALRYNDYNIERGRMDQAVGQVSNLASTDNANLGAYLSALQLAAQLPYTGTQALGSGMGSLLGNYTTTTQSQGLGSSLAGLAGAGLSGWATGGFKL